MHFTDVALHFSVVRYPWTGPFYMEILKVFVFYLFVRCMLNIITQTISDRPLIRFGSTLLSSRIVCSISNFRLFSLLLLFLLVFPSIPFTLYYTSKISWFNLKTSFAIPHSKFMQIVCFDWVNVEQIRIAQHIISFKCDTWSENLAALRILNFYHKIAMRKFNVKRWNGFCAFCVHASLILSCHAWCNLKLLKLNYLRSLTQQTYRIARMVCETFHSEILKFAINGNDKRTKNEIE